MDRSGPDLHRIGPRTAEPSNEGCPLVSAARSRTQASAERRPVDVLAAITGSRVRADVLAALFGSPARPWNPSEMGRAVRRPPQVVGRELRRLASAGFVRVKVMDRHRRYDADLDGPAARELAKLVRQTRGRVPRIRHALVALRSRTLAWVVAGRVMDPLGARHSRHKAALIVLTAAPKALVRVQLANVSGDGVDVHCMSAREWITRLEKGDVALRAARGARKIWVLGSAEELLRRERAELDARRTLTAALANWREELSDEWDEDWDPFTASEGSL